MTPSPPEPAGPPATAALAPTAALPPDDPDWAATRHARGRLTARERLAALFDSHSLRSPPAVPMGTGVCVAEGTIGGRTAVAYAHDARVRGGAIAGPQADATVAAIDRAVHLGCPLVVLAESAGADIEDAAGSLDGYGRIFRAHARASAVIPTLAAVFGACAGGSALVPAAADLRVAVAGAARQFIAGPAVVRAATGLDVTAEALGGAAVQARSGSVDAVVPDEAAALMQLRRWLLWLPDRIGGAPPERPPAGLTAPGSSLVSAADAHAAAVPDDPAIPYDVRPVLAAWCDDGLIEEIQPDRAPSVVTALAHLDGRALGIVANQPDHRAGILDTVACEKAARSLTLFRRLSVPVLMAVDVPGFLPDPAEERAGLVGAAGALMRAYVALERPRLTVILRKAYGGAAVVMGAKALGANAVLAWPGARIGVMGPEAATAVLGNRGAGATLAADAAQAAGLVDAVIDPSETRTRLADLMRRLT